MHLLDKGMSLKKTHNFDNFYETLFFTENTKKMDLFNYFKFLSADRTYQIVCFHKTFNYLLMRSQLKYIKTFTGIHVPRTCLPCEKKMNNY